MCKCGHSYEDHTYSMERTGCDRCNCHVNLVTALEAEIKTERDRCAQIVQEYWNIEEADSSVLANLIRNS